MPVDFLSLHVACESDAWYFCKGKRIKKRAVLEVQNIAISIQRHETEKNEREKRRYKRT